MAMVMALIILLHMALCFFTILLTRMQLTHLHDASFPFMILTPLCGPICAICLELHKRKNSTSSNTTLDKFRLDGEIRRSLGAAGEKEEDVVALEEAMIINSASLRRKLMLEVLNGDVESFCGLLEQARLNDDVEVVHYAATAMAELHKRYDQKLETYAKQHAEAPKSCGVLRDYCDCLKRCFSLGILHGQVLSLRREEHIGLLQELIALEPRMEHYCDLAAQQMEQGDFEAAQTTLQTALRRWPVSEQVRLLQIEFYVRCGQGDAVKRSVEALRRERVYLSAEACQVLAFWDGKADRL